MVHHNANSMHDGNSGVKSNRVLGVASPDHQVGALFEALDEGVLMVPSKSIGYFLPFQVALKHGDGNRCPNV